MVAPNPFAPPESDVLAPTVTTSEDGARGQFQHGKVLVHARSGDFAERCVKCNVPTSNERLKRALYWHPGWVYIFVFPGFLLYAIIALIVRKQATVFVPLCPEHRRSRRNALIGAWLAAIASVGSCTYGSADMPALITLAFVGIVGSMAWAVIAGRVVYPVKIDENWVHLRGVCPEYLARLPPWRVTP